ncbi:Spore maturation protein A [Candidatus Syntrophocurvum alkaliphilum]|uniref:Spore maturation protein A n=1 Tax=Candidatus Syntrophocurvum alkaliphilum TaxID=2293317 RepID=A0A6I6DFH0_9FIRM|nr:nucleoside recognition domain-containing protein [Candidatus Syntrophocurvum alkaliphilum]QGT99896.1 Spore maturation protein A [Candidatus Syntrophocurvum alkaliphilum]
MLNLIWLLLLASGIIVAAINGNIEVVTEAALGAAKGAVEVCFDLIGIMALWLGIMKIAENGGLINTLARLLKPIMVRLFPSVPNDHPAMGAIILNLSANMLGLGNAATPFGMKAMQELQKLNKNSDTASEAMCTFLALNTSCITLIPATIIGVRLSFDSANPTEIVGACIFASLCAMTIAVSLDYWFRTKSPWGRKK